jgi:hypothetical protein
VTDQVRGFSFFVSHADASPTILMSPLSVMQATTSSPAVCPWTITAVVPAVATSATDAAPIIPSALLGIRRPPFTLDAGSSRRADPTAQETIRRTGSAPAP